jgi:threonine synthase
VTDEEIVDGIQLLARTEGIFAETAGGVTVGVLKRLAASRQIDPDEEVVAYITGNGLKTPEAVAERVERPIHIRPTMRAFEESGALAAHAATSVA